MPTGLTPFGLLRQLAFCASLALFSALIVRAMISARILDRPDARKAHRQPTPKGGGVGVVAAFLAGLAVLYLFANFSRLADRYFMGVILAAVAIAVVALLDDLRDWNFTIKLGAQIIAAFIAVATGLYVRVYRLPMLGAVDFGLLGVPATLVWILVATNAMNFIDGLNGLASGVTLIACLFLAGFAAYSGGWFVYFAALLLAAGLIGFLPFNFPRARIFMGDVGSQFCGFMLAILGIAASRFQSVEMSFLLVPMLLSGVMFDVLFTLLRRALARENLASPHRGHIYQLAHRAGMSAVHITLVHWGFAIWAGVICLAFLHAGMTGKMLLPILLAPPQLIWLRYAVRRAHRVGLQHW